MNKLIISLDAVAKNYNMLSSKANCGAVVKANGYGLGALPIAKRLEKEGCKNFFVAHLEEGIALREVIKSADIYVFHGVEKGEKKTFSEYNLIPVLNNASQLAHWSKDKPAAAQFDTGMTRLGFAPEEADKLSDYNIQLVMTHLVSGEDANNLTNKNQLELFKGIAAKFPAARKSLCNSAGVFLDKEFHFDIARPGIALYGGHPTLGKNPMKNVVTLKAPIIQVHKITHQKTVGYNGIYTAEKGDVIATIPVGYADGLHRTLSNKGKVFAGGQELPIVGRISMDLITIKINNLPENLQRVGEIVEILGENYTITDMAEDAGTIDYEIITRLGQRFERIYLEE